MSRSDEQLQARNKLSLFLVLVMLFAAVIGLLRLSVPWGSRLGALSWTPFAADAIEVWSVGLAGLIVLATVDRSFKDLGLRSARLRYLLTAAAIPLAYCIAIYVPVWLSGLGHFRGIPFLGMRFGAAFVYLPLALFLAAGEELGWRGVLVPNLVRVTSLVNTAVVSGVIWAIWHYPDILFFDYNVGTPAIFALPLFSISVIGLGALAAWLRLASNSIWPSVILHGVHNSAMWGVFDRATERGDLTAYLTTEFGLGLAICATAIGCVCWRQLRIIQRSVPCGKSRAVIAP